MATSVASSYKRISVKCRFCGRNQTRYSRAGLWFTCRKCGKRNAGPAVTDPGPADSPEEAPEVAAAKPKTIKAAPKTVHTVSRPAAASSAPPAAKKAPPKRQPRISAVKTTRRRPAAPSGPAPVAPPATAPKGPGLLDRILYG